MVIKLPAMHCNPPRVFVGAIAKRVCFAAYDPTIPVRLCLTRMHGLGIFSREDETSTEESLPIDHFRMLHEPIATFAYQCV